MSEEPRDKVLKKICVWGIFLNIIFFIVLGGFIPIDHPPRRLGDTLIFGTAIGPIDLDPHQAYDPASIDIINQVAEGLVRHDFETNEIIPNLASSWIKAGLNYTFYLVENATFHDGRPFNATWVKRSFDRLNYFLNGTGELSSINDITQLLYFYQWSDKTLIINKTTVIEEFAINFTLNRNFAPFLSLLAFSGSYIFIPLDEDQTTELWTEYMDIVTDYFLGTGPWRYEYYWNGVEVAFKYNPTYWKGPSQVKKLVFSIINDANTRIQALLVGDIHFVDDPLPSQFSTLQVDPNIQLINVGPGLTIQSLGMNNKLINSTWRQVISHVFDYDFVINSLLNGNAFRLESPIPLGISCANWIHQEARYNLTKARIIMQSMGYGYDEYGNPWGILNTFEDNYNWTIAARYTPFRFFNFTYHLGNQFREDIYYMLLNQFELIGVELNAAIISWDDFLNRVYERGIFNRNMLELYWLGRGPDYNDPSNYINSLFTNRSVASNSAQYNGFQAANEAGRNPLYLWDNIQLLMEAALEETNKTTRTAMYNRIQQILVEEDMPWVYAYVSIDYDAHIRELYGYPYNNMGELYFYPCRFIYPPI